MRTTPSEQLAEIILKRLTTDNLISSRSAEKLLPLLAEGKLQPDDWRLAVELGKEKEARQ